MKTALKVMIMFAFVLTLGAFSAFAGPDSAEIAADKENWFDFPGAVYLQTDKHFTGTTRIHPFSGTRTSIVVEDGVIKIIYQPWYIQFDDSTFNGTNQIQLDGTALSVGENIVNDSVFSGTNQIDNDGSYPLKANPTNTVNNTTFEDNTTIDTYYQLAQAEGTSAIGTQISGSTFNDNTTLNVQSGGTLEITDSTINLADESIMEKYFGLNSPLVYAVNLFSAKFYSVMGVILGTLYEPIDSLDDVVSNTSTINGVTASTKFIAGTFIQSVSLNDYHDIVVTKHLIQGGLIRIIMNYLGFIMDYIDCFFTKFSDWYYPFADQVAFQYWYAWNSDTQQKEQTNIATVLYYVTWYLGQMYQMNTWTAGEELQQPIEDLNDKFNDLDNAEDGIWNSISGSFDGFDPDPGSVSDLGAIGWCANYLQEIYVSLGAFNIPIMVGLLLGVCMQFIGYFKYKYQI